MPVVNPTGWAQTEIFAGVVAPPGVTHSHLQAESVATEKFTGVVLSTEMVCTGGSLCPTTKVKASTAGAAQIGVLMFNVAEITGRFPETEEALTAIAQVNSPG